METYLKKIITLLLIATVLPATMLMAQQENAIIRNGNKLYKQKQFEQSQQQYQKAVEKTPDDPIANYNLGNSQFRKNSFDEAAKSYQNSVDHTTDQQSKANGLYNQGVALIKQKKLEESIASWKNALKLNPKDQDLRDNLQKALQELKNKQQQEKKDDKKEDDKKQDKKDQDKKDQQNQQQQQKPQSKLTKKQVEQLLQALQQKEKEAQEKMNQNKVKSLSQPEKDW